MIKIGLIGSIGSGKSFVAKQFGFPIFNADNEISKIYKKDKNCFKKLKKIIPKYVKSFPIKKSELTKAILENKKNLKKITKIVHPLIKNKMKVFLKKNKRKKMVILDIPLLMENKINNKNFYLIFVDAKKKEIMKRLNKRPNFNYKLFKKFEKLQLPIEIKKKNSNFLIKNNFRKMGIKKSVKLIKKKIFQNERNNTRY